MDYEFVSKVILVICLYFLANYFYKSIEWHSSSKDEKKDFQFFMRYFFISIFGVAFLYGIVVFGLIILFQGSLEYLETRSYLEQIAMSLAAIVIYFSFQINLDGRKIKEKEKGLLMEEQRKMIRELERKIKFLEKQKE